MPRVTVGMPVWNAVGTVRESIDSVLAQDFTDFELVVSDNASTDGTADVVAEYERRDSRVRLVRHAENRGGAENFSCLPALATTELFKWQSGDDLVAPTMLSRCIEVLDAHPDAVLAYGKTTMVDEDGYFWRHHDDRLHLPQPQAWRRIHGFAMRRWLCNPLFGVIRREPLLGTSLLTKNLSADVTLLAQLALRGTFHEVPDRLFVRRFADRSCGLGSLTDAEKLSWFDPKRATAPRLKPDTRVLLDIHRAIAVAPLSPAEKIAAVVAFDAAKARRRLGIWRYQRRLARRGEAFPTWDSLRERPTADLPPGVRVRPDAEPQPAGR